MTNTQKGVTYALLAALANSSLGVANQICFLSNMSYFDVAIYRCGIALVMLTAIASFSDKHRNAVWSMRKHVHQIAVLAFFGVFLLYTYETKAFSMLKISTVSFTVYACGILTVILGTLVLKEPLTLGIVLGLALVIVGECYILGEVPNLYEEATTGVFYALLGGIGYSMFLVLCRMYALPVNIGLLWWLLGIGFIYLLSYAFVQKIQIGFYVQQTPYLIFLALIPTLGGFYFSAKSLQYMQAGKVQILEMSDPFFSVLFAKIFLDQTIQESGIWGSILILSGLFVSQNLNSWRLPNVSKTVS